MRTPTRLDRYRPPPRRLAAWAAEEPDLAGLDYDALRAGQLDPAVPAEVRDRRLRALLRLARRDPDALATAVACLLPGLGRVVRPHRASLGSDAWPAAIAELCHVIRCHRWEDEPDRLARRLLAAVRSRLRTLSRREDAWAGRTTRLVVPTDDDRAGGVVDGPEASASRLLPDAIAAGVLTRQAAVLIADTQLDGVSLTQAAQRLDIGYGAAAKRYQRGRRALAVWLTDDRRAA